MLEVFRSRSKAWARAEAIERFTLAHDRRLVETRRKTESKTRSIGRDKTSEQDEQETLFSSIIIIVYGVLPSDVNGSVTQAEREKRAPRIAGTQGIDPSRPPLLVHSRTTFTRGKKTHKSITCFIRVRTSTKKENRSRNRKEFTIRTSSDNLHPLFVFENRKNPGQTSVDTRSLPSPSSIFFEPMMTTTTTTMDEEKRRRGVQQRRSGNKGRGFVRRGDGPDTRTSWLNGG